MLDAIDLLRRYELELLLAVRPGQDARPVAEACTRAGVRLALWPMLADEEGRWASTRNAERFTAFAREVAGTRGAGALAFDFEPEIESVRAAIGGRVPRLPAPKSFDAARARFRAMAEELRAGGRGAYAAVLPPVLLDDPNDSPRWQKLLGTPVDTAAYDHVSVMLYTSMLEGWSRGVFTRDAARAMLAAGCRSARARFGEHAGASLGAVGTGALGDEPVYRSPAELADDVAIARAAGVDDLALFDLGGVLRRPPVEPWLDAFTRTEPAAAPPPESGVVRAFFSVADVTTASLRAIAPILRATGIT